MPYHKLNNLDASLNGYLTAKVGRVIISTDLMDRYYIFIFCLRSTLNVSMRVNSGKMFNLRSKNLFV